MAYAPPPNGYAPPSNGYVPPSPGYPPPGYGPTPPPTSYGSPPPTQATPSLGAPYQGVPGSPYASPSVPAPAGPVSPVWPGSTSGFPGQQVLPNGAPDPNRPIAPNLAPPFYGPDSRYADVVVNLQEAPTGRLMIGAAVNSEAGVTGQIIVDERNFDWRAVPKSWDDVISGRAFRGAGQTFRLEALPGNQFERYQVNFSEPFFLNTPWSLDLSGYLFTRNYFDWNEGRVGGRVGLGYRVTPDLSVAGQFRAEEIRITDPRVAGVSELDASLGSNEAYGLRLSVAHDTRDLPFNPTQGHFLELSFEQVLGTFDYPRGILDFRKYYLVTERADGSGRHVLGFANRFGVTGCKRRSTTTSLPADSRPCAAFSFAARRR